MSIASRFMESLQEMEKVRDVSILLPLFDENIKLSNLSSHFPEVGLEGAKLFWDQYLDLFNDIRSSFIYQIETSEGACLEWTSEGKLKDGKPIIYNGVSVIEFKSDKITSFRTYYETTPFLRITENLEMSGALTDNGFYSSNREGQNPPESESNISQ